MRCRCWHAVAASSRGGCLSWKGKMLMATRVIQDQMAVEEMLKAGVRAVTRMSRKGSHQNLAERYASSWAL
eukprot:79753-Pelagomonas_calceolata.AAC.7